MRFVIEQTLAQAVLNYLARQPYAEVFELIAELQRLESVDDDKQAE